MQENRRRLKGIEWIEYRSEKAHDEPRLSAAIMIPSLYLMARTDASNNRLSERRTKMRNARGTWKECTVCVAWHH